MLKAVGKTCLLVRVKITLEFLDGSTDKSDYTKFKYKGKQALVFFQDICIRK